MAGPGSWKLGFFGVAALLALSRCNGDSGRDRGEQLFSSPGQTSQTAPVTAPTAASQPELGNGLAAVTLNRAFDSHFYADAQVNGATVHFMIDTGATSLVLTKADAQRAGVGTGDYTASGIGVGGEIRLMPVNIDRVAIGPLSASNVPAMVAEDGLTISLMGQSYLSRVGTVTISGDKMVLR